ncbi:maltose/maltodextrin ABC transporter substrate-binding protein MalE [Hahella sp. CR1]|uniref:maltose/maltodextrin ABC transporter substrate-binding protein MalE n=1 Tax=Hahella sp. CR1 TaxID=2992807 RepID=UPI0024437372|nr:maltose/maltodextrin ABC transporter substrate-binding protein MalE [Hahella sp. CR1]MDG9668742.1 maltose/maltodextrin ABC transporter substrate-binding protein MalE [Hahella sp. CR1]
MSALKNLFTLALCLVSTFACAFEKDSLIVWIGADKGSQGVAEAGAAFTAATGMKVKVETPDDLTVQFDRLAPTAQGPDIVIWAHERFGPWINDGFLEPVTPSQKMRDSVAPFTWRALTVGDDIYGFPIAIEAVSLIYNKALVKAPPRTLQDVIALDRDLRKQGKKAIEWDYKNTYFSWPFIAGAGGYSFGKSDGVYNLADVGFDSSGSVDAVQAIKQLLDQGVLEKTADYGSMMNGFKKGDVAMIINGPWSWREIRDAGVNFGVDYIPGLTAEHPGRPFVGVLAAGINSAGRNKEAAQRFLEDYLLTYEGLKKVNTDKPLGAVANVQLMKELSADPLIRHTFVSAEKGELMPDVPEMKRFWGLFTYKLPAMLKGEAAISATLNDMADRLRKLDELKGWGRRHYLSDKES